MLGSCLITNRLQVEAFRRNLDDAQGLAISFSDHSHGHTLVICLRGHMIGSWGRVRGQHVPYTDDAGRLLNYEAAAKVEAFRGNLDNARRLFREGKMRCRPSSRYLREWGAFEKRSGSLDVSHRRPITNAAIFGKY